MLDTRLRAWAALLVALGGAASIPVALDGQEVPVVQVDPGALPRPSLEALQTTERIVVDGGELLVERGSGAFLSRACSEFARPTGRLEPEVDSRRNFGAEVLT